MAQGHAEIDLGSICLGEVHLMELCLPLSIAPHGQNLGAETARFTSVFTGCSTLLGIARIFGTFVHLFGVFHSWGFEKSLLNRHCHPSI